MSEAVQALREGVGEPSPGRPAVVLSAPGVGKTPLLVRFAVAAMAEGRRVLHVGVGDAVEHVRAHYDAVLRDEGHAPHALDRRRMVLSVPESQLDPRRLAVQLRTLVEASGFAPDLVVLDGLHASSWSAHGHALVALSEARAAPMWVGVTADGALPADGPEVAFVLALSAAQADGTVRLERVVDGRREPLPWVLDPVTQAPVDTSAASLGALRAGDVTLFSGGAGGAEAAFGAVAARHGSREVAFSFEGHRQERTEGRVVLSDRELEAGDVSLVYVSRRLHREYNQHGLVRRVLQTLWHMVSRAEQVFVVGVIQPDGTVVGGTGWSVELARMWRRDLWVYDQERHGWFRWSGTAWTAGEPRISSPAVCGTGTRYLEPHGRQAIEALWIRSFGPARDGA